MSSVILQKFNGEPLVPHVKQVASRTKYEAEGLIARVPKTSSVLGHAEMLVAEDVLTLIEETEDSKVYKWNIDVEPRYTNICVPPKIIACPS